MAASSLILAQEKGDVLERRYTFSIAPTSLIEAIGLIRAETGVRFVYSPSNLPADQLVEVTAENESLDAILRAVFEPMGIEYQVIAGQVALRWKTQEERVAFTQTIRGRVVDQDTQAPLLGVNVVVDTTTPLRGASTDEQGYFAIPKLPLGRHTVTVHYIGFNTMQFAELLLTAGKELVLEIGLAPLPIEMEQILVAEEPDLYVPLNESAVASARSFSVEQTQRFAASLSDPARMAQSFAGVSRSEDDLLNEVIVRGHSPKYTVWRLEGIEIPNPNHFGDDGFSSGGVSMLSANMLTYSDFFTGAFPAEYSNALAGVFDVNLRRGNTERREHSIQLGVLGAEGSIEGPFQPGYGGSYLVNYRYSTAGLLAQADLIEADRIVYQDLAFKVHLPTRSAGTFSLFGLGGLSENDFIEPRNLAQWQGNSFGVDEFVQEKRGLVGIGHTLVLSPSSYVRSVFTGFYEEQREQIYAFFSSSSLQDRLIDEENEVESGVRGKSTLHVRVSPRHVLQVGIGGDRVVADYVFREIRRLEDNTFWDLIDTGTTVQTWRSFAQWTYRPNTSWRFYAGVHGIAYGLSRERTVEPRFGAEWKLSEQRTISVATGLHSQMESIGIYIQHRERAGVRVQPNKNLRTSKSWHNVLAFEERFTNNTRFRAETYYHAGYDIPVGETPGSIFSVINTYYLYDVLVQPEALVSEGTTSNYGVDLTYEKLFSRGYYFLLTGSLFDASFTTRSGVRYSSRYDTNFMLNAVGGIEYKLGRKKQHVLGLNSRILFGGGNRSTPIDIEASIREGREVLVINTPYAEQLAPYFRVDLGLRYTIDQAYSTHMFYLEAQNAINRSNTADTYYDRARRSVRFTQQTGILPVLGYRLTF